MSNKLYIRLSRPENDVNHYCGCFESNDDYIQLSKLFPSYSLYPFKDIVTYKKDKYVKSVTTYQKGCFLFKFSNAIIVNILSQFNFTDLKSLCLVSVSFYKLMISDVGEMALRKIYLSNKIACKYDKIMGVYSKFSIFPTNKRFWWCKIKSFKAIVRFFRGYSKSLDEFESHFKSIVKSLDGIWIDTHNLISNDVSDDSNIYECVSVDAFQKIYNYYTRKSRFGYELDDIDFAIEELRSGTLERYCHNRYYDCARETLDAW